MAKKHGNKRRNYEKEFKSLKFTNDYMFSRVNETHPNISKGMIRIVTKIELGKYQLLKSQYILNNHFDAKSVRYDVFVKSLKKHFDIEMQTVKDKNIVKRARYYASTMDTDSLTKGKKYKDLPDSIIIFICLYDPFPPFNKPIYVEKGRLFSEEKDISEETKYNNGCVKIYVNTKADLDLIEDEDLKALLLYLNTGEVTDEFTQEIAQGLDETRNSKKEVRRYMTLQSVIDEKIEVAKQQGRQEGMKKGISKGLAQGRNQEREDFIYAMFKDGLSIEQISRIANISIDKVKKIIASKTRN